jgi:hypothetical protein
MTKRIILPLLIALLAAGQLYAQNIRTSKLQWTVVELTDLGTQSTMPYQSQFVTDSSNPIAWIQDDGDFTSSLTIQSISGDWTNVAENGAINYQVNLDGTNGELTIARTSDGMKITLHLTSATVNIHHQYKVSQVTSL